ncbi:hypothetical protein JCM3770_001366 [Rhodotorula araucariae]
MAFSSDTDDGWSTASDWTDRSPLFEPAHGEPSTASSHAVAALRHVKHSSLFSAADPASFAFDARASHALDATKTLLRFIAETAPGHFTPHLDKLAGLQDACSAALGAHKTALDEPTTHTTADLQAQEAANRKAAMDDLRALRKETEAALATAADKYAAEGAALRRELRGVFTKGAARKNKGATAGKRKR